eukprot:gene2540-2781_t
MANNSMPKNDSGEVRLNPLDYIRPVLLVTREDCESHRLQVCDRILQHIREGQRTKRVQSLRMQMQQSRQQPPPMMSRERLAGSHWPLQSTELTFSSDLYSTDSEESLGEEQLIESFSNSHPAMTSPQSLSSEEPDSTPFIRFPHRKDPPKAGQKQAAVFSPHAKELLSRSGLVSEEIFWELSLPQGSRILDSKLFFFAHILWKITFGVNNHHLEYYYVFVSPAEKLLQDFAMRCEFVLHPSAPLLSSSDLGDSAVDHKEGQPLASYRKASEGFFLFPMKMNTSRGFEKFIGPEVRDYLSADKKLRLSVILTTQPAASPANTK